MTHGTFATMDNDRYLQKVEGRKGLDFTIWDFKRSGNTTYTAFPVECLTYSFESWRFSHVATHS